MLAFDIQLEIIKRLPVKSLIQFRSVCKAWKSIIDSSQFIAGYRSQSSQHLMIRYEGGQWDEEEVKYVSYVDDDTFPQQNFAPTLPALLQSTITINSSHGLLCLISYTSDDNFDPTCKTEIALLWNPTIKKSVTVAVPNEVHKPFNYVVGFGVCPDTKDPKLVKITYIDDDQKMESISSIPCQVMVFTLSSGEWTCLSTNQQLPRKSIRLSWLQAVIGQFIYWLACDRINVDDGFCNLIMSFDMSSQEFREIDLPDSLADVLQLDLSVSRLRESLVLLEYSIDYTICIQVCDVWMMEHGDSKAFTKLFTVNVPNASVSQTLGFRKSGEPILEVNGDSQDFGTPCALMVYEPWSEHIRDLGIRGIRLSFFVTSYTESLLLLNHDDGQIIRC